MCFTSSILAAHSVNLTFLNRWFAKEVEDEGVSIVLQHKSLHSRQYYLLNDDLLTRHALL